MAFEQCIDEIQRAAGRELSEEELTALGERFETLVRRYRDEDVDDLQEAVLRAVDEFNEELQAAAIIEKRNAALNERARLQAIDYIRTVWKDAPHIGLRALLGGVATDRPSSRMSVALAQEQLSNRYVQGLISKLEKEGVREIFTRGVMDREIWRAMHEVSKPEPNERLLAELPQEAVTIARILEEYNEKARQDANRAGAWIKKLPGRVIKQTHDQYRIRQAGPEEWKAFVRERLDMKATLEAMQRRRADGSEMPTEEALERFLDDMYTRFASGAHYKVATGGEAGFKGFANIGRRLSQERVLHFKDADASFEYNQRFGVGNLAEGMLYGLEHMAQSTALMRHLGPNAEMVLDEVIDRIGRDVQNTHDTRALERFDKEVRFLKRALWPNLTGEARAAQNHLFAKASGMVRAIQQMSKLGSAVLSAVADIPFYASEVRYQGGSMLSGMAEALSGLLEGKTSIEKQELIGMLGVLHDGMRASAVSRFDVSDAIPGRVAKTTQLFFKLSGLRWWTDRLRTTMALASAHRLALRAGARWDELGEELTRVLSMYGLDAGKWDILRAAPKAEVEGRAYLTPEALDDLDDAPFAGYLEARGLKPTAARIRELRDELKEQLRSYFADRATVAVLEPDARTRAILLQGTRPGTVEGELLRHVMLFKSFAATVIQKPLAREVYGRGADPNASILQALRSGNGELWGLAQLIVVNTLFGYGALALKDLAKGRTPRDPNSKETWFAAMTQGGGLGIYGDFLFGEVKNRFGGNFVSTLMGPTAGSINDLADLWGRMRDGDDAAAAAFRTLVNHAPFANLFYTRAALDYLILYRVAETMNPGYLRRMERRLKRENDQEFLLPPSRAIPYGGGL